jgi:sarcosine oxidase
VTDDAEIVVVGAGIAGAATARALARSGHAVVLLEQFAIGHAHGSSHGGSRIFRLSYPEERYVRLARRALDGWRELEAEAGEKLILPTGSLDLRATANVNAAALAACDVDHERLTGAEVAKRWPIAVEPTEPALFQPDGGVTRADRAYAAFLRGARAAGADVREEQSVTAIKVGDDAVSVVTEAETIRARAVVVTAGAWARRLLEPLGFELPVTVTRETVTYFALERAEELPTLIDDISPSRIGSYGLAAPGVGLKAGLHRSGPVVDPNTSGDPDPDIVRDAAAWVARRYPQAHPEPISAETCLYTCTPDEDFVLERRGRLVVGSACSGHGFKFAPVVGETLAALAHEAV